MHMTINQPTGSGATGNLLGAFAAIGNPTGDLAHGFGAMLAQLLGGGASSGSTGDALLGLATQCQPQLGELQAWGGEQLSELQAEHGEALGPLLEQLGAKLQELLNDDASSEMPPEIAALLASLAQQLAPAPVVTEEPTAETSDATLDAVTEATAQADANASAGAATAGAAAVVAQPMQFDPEQVDAIVQRMAALLQQVLPKPGAAVAAEQLASPGAIEQAAADTQGAPQQWNLQELTVALRSALRQSGLVQEAVSEASSARNTTGATATISTAQQAAATLGELTATAARASGAQQAASESAASEPATRATLAPAHPLNNLTARLLQAVRGGSRAARGDSPFVNPVTPNSAAAATATAPAPALEPAAAQLDGTISDALKANASAGAFAGQQSNRRGIAEEADASTLLNLAAAPVAPTTIADAPAVPMLQADRMATLEQVQALTEQLLASSAGVVRSGNGTVEANLTLNPVELGEVRVALTLQQDGSLQAQMSATRPETAALIAQHSQQLSEALSRPGLGFDHVQVTVPGISQSGATQSGGQGMGQQMGQQGGGRESFLRDMAWNSPRQGQHEQRQRSSSNGQQGYQE